MKEVKEQLIWTSSKNANKWAARVFHMVISHEQMRQLPEPVILTPDCTFYLSGELLKIPIPRHHPHRQNQQSQRWGPDFRAHLKLPSELNSQPNLGVLNLGLLSHQSTWPKYPVLGKFGIMAFQLCFVTSLGKQPLLRHPLLLLAWFTLSLFAGVCSGIYRDVTQRVKLNESLPFKLPWETHPSGNKNLRVRAPVLEYTKARLFHKRLLLTFWRFRKPHVLPSLTDVTTQVTRLEAIVSREKSTNEPARHELSSTCNAQVQPTMDLLTLRNAGPS